MLSAPQSSQWLGLRITYSDEMFYNVEDLLVAPRIWLLTYSI